MRVLWKATAVALLLLLSTDVSARPFSSHKSQEWERRATDFHDDAAYKFLGGKGALFSYPMPLTSPPNSADFQGVSDFWEIMHSKVLANDPTASTSARRPGTIRRDGSNEQQTSAIDPRAVKPNPFFNSYSPTSLGTLERLWDWSNWFVDEYGPKLKEVVGEKFAVLTEVIEEKLHSRALTADTRERRSFDIETGLDGWAAAGARFSEWSYFRDKLEAKQKAKETLANLPPDFLHSIAEDIGIAPGQ